MRLNRRATYALLTASIAGATFAPLALASATQPKRSLTAAANVELVARSILDELIAINTTVSTGSTTPAARKLAARFLAAGFPAADVMVMGRGPKSGKVIVRWRGTTRAKPIVFNAHLDVVEAPRLDWGTNPFVLTEKDGYLYGRGVTDDKGPAAAIAETPVDRLARALDKVGRHRFPVELNPIMRSFFEKQGPLAGGDLGAAMTTLARDATDMSAQRTLLADRRMASLLRTTCIATMLRGGTARNAIPQEVGATVNCRVLPGTAQDDVIRTLRDAIADTNVVVNVVSAMHPSDPSMPSAALMAMIERVVSVEHPGAPVIPYMETGATDGLWFRNAGIPVFGVAGFFIDEADLQRAHGKDERISVAGFNQMVRYSVRLLFEVAATR